MKKIAFEIRTADVEVRNIEQIEQGCANNAAPESDIVATFDNKQDALVELAKYTSTADYFSGSSHYWLVREYWVEENEYTLDEDGDIEDCEYCGVWGYAPFECEPLDDFIEDLWNNAVDAGEMDIETARNDLRNFFDAGWIFPKGITAEAYMEAWNERVRKAGESDDN